MPASTRAAHTYEHCDAPSLAAYKSELHALSHGDCQRAYESRVFDSTLTGTTRSQAAQRPVIGTRIRLMTVSERMMNQCQHGCEHASDSRRRQQAWPPDVQALLARSCCFTKSSWCTVQQPCALICMGVARPVPTTENALKLHMACTHMNRPRHCSARSNSSSRCISQFRVSRMRFGQTHASEVLCWPVPPELQQTLLLPKGTSTCRCRGRGS